MQFMVYSSLSHQQQPKPKSEREGWWRRRYRKRMERSNAFAILFLALYNHRGSVFIVRPYRENVRPGHRETGSPGQHHIARSYFIKCHNIIIEILKTIVYEPSLCAIHLTCVQCMELEAWTREELGNGNRAAGQRMPGTVCVYVCVWMRRFCGAVFFTTHGLLHSGISISYCGTIGRAAKGQNGGCIMLLAVAIASTILQLLGSQPI